MKLHNEKNASLLFKKKDYLAKVLDYFMPVQEQQEQTIFKLINELHTKNVISAETQKLLQFAVVQYQFNIVDILAQCEELHVRLYDNQDKYYSKKSKCFYKGVN